MSYVCPECGDGINNCSCLSNLLAKELAETKAKLDETQLLAHCLKNDFDTVSAELERLKKGMPPKNGCPWLEDCKIYEELKDRIEELENNKRKELREKFKNLPNTNHQDGDKK